MTYLKTFEECESFVRIATLQSSQLCYLNISIQEALHVQSNEEHLSTIRMLNALINARNDLDQLPYDSVVMCGMILYRVTFVAATVHITTEKDVLIIILAL